MDDGGIGLKIRYCSDDEAVATVYIRQWLFGHAYLGRVTGALKYIGCVCRREQDVGVNEAVASKPIGKEQGSVTGICRIARE